MNMSFFFPPLFSFSVRLCICYSSLINGRAVQKLIILLSRGTRWDLTLGIWLWLLQLNKRGPIMRCVIPPSSRCLSCTVTAGWAPGMGGLISPLSIRSLLAVLEMGGNTILLQFDFKPYRSISWTAFFFFSHSSFYHYSPSVIQLPLSLILHLYHSKRKKWDSVPYRTAPVWLVCRFSWICRLQNVNLRSV